MILEKYNNLRNKYPQFTFKSYSYEITEKAVNVKYRFEIDSLAAFEPTWVLKKDENITLCENDAVLEKLIFSLGLVELVSYWKITCSPYVKICCGYLDAQQVQWWKKQYFYGLGEFFYVNGITADFDSFMEIETAENKKITGEKSGVLLGGCLVPVGGGKDSAVTIEILKSAENLCCYVINPRGATDLTAKAAQIPDKNVLAARRTLDKNMLDLNRRGFLNGHTPFSAIVAFSSVITAYLNGKKYVALSNEASANESTVKNSKINHQYSKSFDFEYDFHCYEEKYIGSGVYYFSMLRPLSEFQIAKYFAEKKQYHPVFKSCNTGSKQNIWCGACPKCLFVYLILSPFLTETELIRIFGENLLEKDTLLDTFEKLTGIKEEKPFECVGSRAEVNEAIRITIERLCSENKPLPLLFEHYRGKNMLQPPSGAYSSYYNRENLLPDKFLKILADAVYGGKLPETED